MQSASVFSGAEATLWRRLFPATLCSGTVIEALQKIHETVALGF
jgi:hypothetical protein